MADVRWGGEDWSLLSRRGVYWRRRRTVLVADMHLGKPAAFAAAGIPVPHSCPHDLDRLADMIGAAPGAVDRLVILGDLLHARSGCTDFVLDALFAWRTRHRSLDVLLIRGNHDDRAGDPPVDLQFRVVTAPAYDLDDGSVRLCHFPPADPHQPVGGLSLCGHLHPAVRLTGPVSTTRLPCFWLTPCAMVLPAFGAFTGDRVVRPREGDRLFAVGPDSVVEVPAVLRRSGARRSMRC